MKKYAVAAVVVVFMVAWGWWAVGNRVTITNESGQALRLLAVCIGDKTTQFDDIQAGGSVSVTFGVLRDEDYICVRGQLQNGTEFSDFGSYLVSGTFGQWFGMAVRAQGEVVDTTREQR